MNLLSLSLFRSESSESSECLEANPMKRERPFTESFEHLVKLLQAQSTVCVREIVLAFQCGHTVGALTKTRIKAFWNSQFEIHSLESVENLQYGNRSRTCNRYYLLGS